MDTHSDSHMDSSADRSGSGDIQEPAPEQLSHHHPVRHTACNLYRPDFKQPMQALFPQIPSHPYTRYRRSGGCGQRISGRDVRILLQSCFQQLWSSHVLHPDFPSCPHWFNPLFLGSLVQLYTHILRCPLSARYPLRLPLRHALWHTLLVYLQTSMWPSVITFRLQHIPPHEYRLLEVEFLHHFPYGIHFAHLCTRSCMHGGFLAVIPILGCL